MAEGGGGRPRVRPVRCSRCDDLLMDFANLTSHRCGSRNATFRDPSETESSLGSYYEAKPSYLNEFDRPWNKKGVAFVPGSGTGGESIGFDLRKEEKLGISLGASSRRKFVPRIDDKVDPRSRANGAHDGGCCYPRSSRTPLSGSTSTSSEDDMARGFLHKRGTRLGRNRVPAFGRMAAEQMEATPSPVYQEEGSSTLHDRLSYREKYSKKNVSRTGTEYLSRDPLQLLRQLDEIRDQISRSCETAEGSREKMPVAERPVGSSRSCEDMDPPREKMPVTEVYYKRIQNSDSLHHNHGYEEQHGPRPLWKAPYLLSAHHAERSTNEVRGEISKQKDKNLCEAFAGAAPFVVCSICFELLRLPQVVLLVSKKPCKLRCGSCSKVFSIELVGKRLVTSRLLPSTPLPEANCSSDAKVIQNVHSKALNCRQSYTSSTEDFRGHCKSMQAIDGTESSRSMSSHGLMGKESTFDLREADQMEGLSISSDVSDNVESHDNTIRQQTASITKVAPPNVVSPKEDYLVGPLSNQAESFENPSINQCSFRKMTVDKLQQSGDVDEAVTEVDLSVNEYASSSLSQDYLETEKNQIQTRMVNHNESLVQKRSFEDYALYNLSIRDERHEVSVNGHPIPDHLVKKAETKAGRVLPGEYWYDSRAGFWGAMGEPCLGIILPFIEEFNYPMSKNCAGGNTGVLVNGRELHKKDLNLLVSRGFPPTSGQYYVLEFSGIFFDEFTGEELGSIGKLAPTVEKMGRGFGMNLPM